MDPQNCNLTPSPFWKPWRFWTSRHAPEALSIELVFSAVLLWRFLMLRAQTWYTNPQDFFARKDITYVGGNSQTRAVTLFQGTTTSFRFVSRGQMARVKPFGFPLNKPRQRVATPRRQAKSFCSGLWDEGVSPHFCDTSPPIYINKIVFGKPFLLYHRSGHSPQP